MISVNQEQTPKMDDTGNLKQAEEPSWLIQEKRGLSGNSRRNGVSSPDLRVLVFESWSPWNTGYSHSGSVWSNEALMRNFKCPTQMVSPSSLESAVLMGCWHLHQKMKLRSEQRPRLPSASRPASWGSSCKVSAPHCQCHRGWKPRKPDPRQKPDPGLVQRRGRP